MKNTIYLEPKQVPSYLRGSYSGRQFKAVVAETVTIPADAGLWSGGTRATFRIVRLADGADARLSMEAAAPWDDRRVERVIPLRGGIAVIEHSMFCGKDMGLTIYVHPENAAALLPAPTAVLSELEAVVLEATASLKSSYAGKDRREMTNDNRRYSGKPLIGRYEWEVAKQSLIGRGYLNKAGAITTAGRNARKR
jgi:hypothetical protein